MIFAADTAVTSPLVTTVVALIIGVCGGGGLAALLRIRADRGKVVIEAAQGAVIVQTSVIDDLHTELARVKAELAEVRETSAQREAESQRREAEWQKERVQMQARLTAVEHTATPDA